MDEVGRFWILLSFSGSRSQLVGCVLTASSRHVLGCSVRHFNSSTSSIPAFSVRFPEFRRRSSDFPVRLSLAAALRACASDAAGVCRSATFFSNPFSPVQCSSAFPMSAARRDGVYERRVANAGAQAVSRTSASRRRRRIRRRRRRRRRAAALAAVPRPARR